MERTRDRDIMGSGHLYSKAKFLVNSKMTPERTRLRSDRIWVMTLKDYSEFCMQWRLSIANFVFKLCCHYNIAQYLRVQTLDLELATQ